MGCLVMGRLVMGCLVMVCLVMGSLVMERFEREPYFEMLNFVNLCFDLCTVYFTIHTGLTSMLTILITLINN